MVYSRQTDAEELEKGATEWIRGGGNIPRFDLNHVDLDPVIPYPLNVAKILNFEWKRAMSFSLVFVHHPCTDGGFYVFWFNEN